MRVGVNSVQLASDIPQKSDERSNTMVAFSFLVSLFLFAVSCSAVQAQQGLEQGQGLEQESLCKYHCAGVLVEEKRRGVHKKYSVSISQFVSFLLFSLPSTVLSSSSLLPVGHHELRLESQRSVLSRYLLAVVSLLVGLVCCSAVLAW